MFWSILMGPSLRTSCGCRPQRNVQRAGRFQMGVEMLVGWSGPGKAWPSENSRRFVSPLALTVFLWIALMNALDLIPVDLAPWLFAVTGLGAERRSLYYHKILPATLTCQWVCPRRTPDYAVLRHQAEAVRVCQKLFSARSRRPVLPVLFSRRSTCC